MASGIAVRCKGAIELAGGAHELDAPVGPDLLQELQVEVPGHAQDMPDAPLLQTPDQLVADGDPHIFVPP